MTIAKQTQNARDGHDSESEPVHDASRRVPAGSPAPNNDTPFSQQLFQLCGYFASPADRFKKSDVIDVILRRRARTGRRVRRYRQRTTLQLGCGDGIAYPREPSNRGLGGETAALS